MKVEIVTAEDLMNNLQACARGIYGIVYPDGKTHDKPFVVDLAKEIGTLAALNTPDIVWLSRTPEPSPIEILKKIIAAPEPDPNPAAVEEAQPAAGDIDADPEETPYKEPEAEQAEVTEESAEPAPAEMPEESAGPAPMEMPEESAELVSAETPEEPAPAEKTKIRGGCPEGSRGMGEISGPCIIDQRAERSNRRNDGGRLLDTSDQSGCPAVSADCQKPPQKNAGIRR